MGTREQKENNAGTTGTIAVFKKQAKGTLGKFCWEQGNMDPPPPPLRGPHFSGAPTEKIVLSVSERSFYGISVPFVRFNWKGLFLNAKKNVSAQIR